MKRTSKIWLWIALVLCVCTTGLNLAEGRWLSVTIAILSIAGLCALLFAGRRLGYIVMCLCAVGSFAVGVAQNVGALGAVTAVVMSLIGSALVPVVTGLFIRSQWRELK